MFLIDSHAHLDEQSFEADFEEMIERAHAASVKGLVTIGITIDSCRRALALAEKYPAVRAAVGIHPNYVSQAAFEDWGLICEMARHPHVVAVGETGLNRYWDHSPIEHAGRLLRAAHRVVSRDRQAFHRSLPGSRTGNSGGPRPGCSRPNLHAERDHALLLLAAPRPLPAASSWG